MEIRNQGLIILIKRGEVSQSLFIRLKSLLWAKEKNIEIKDQSVSLVITEGSIFKAKAVAIQLEKFNVILKRLNEGEILISAEVISVQAELQNFIDSLWIIEKAGAEDV